MLSDCKVGCCTSPPPGLCVISQGDCLQTRVPLPLIKPLKQGLYPGKNPCEHVCEYRERERACLCVRLREGGVEGRGRQWCSSVCTCVLAHVTYREEKWREWCGRRCVGEERREGARQDIGSLSRCLLREGEMKEGV